MKNLFIAACAFAVLAFTSCQKDDVSENADKKVFDVTLSTNLNQVAQSLGDFNVLSNSPMQSQAIQKAPNMTGVTEYPFVTELTITLTGNGITPNYGPLVFVPVAGVLTCDTDITLGDPMHTVNPDGSIYLHNIPLGNYDIQITATNGHDAEAYFSNWNGHFAFHSDYEEYGHASQLAREEILNWIQESDELTGPTTYPEDPAVPVRKDWVSGVFTTAVPAITYSQQAPHEFQLKLQNDLFAILVHRQAAHRVRINTYVLLNDDYVTNEEDLKDVAIGSYYNCQDPSHTDFLTAFQDSQFSLLDASPIDAGNYSVFMVVTDQLYHNDILGCVRIPLEDLIGGKVHFAEMYIDRTSVRIRNLSLSFESFDIDEWTSDIFVTGEITVQEEWPLNPGSVTVTSTLGL